MTMILDILEVFLLVKPSLLPEIIGIGITSDICCKNRKWFYRPTVNKGGDPVHYFNTLEMGSLTQLT